ncbi:MAG: TetR/AcrR family transcriptional regulator [Burkholderiales bacterium]
MTPATKARLEEARRTQILEAAARVFARKGFDGATISDIARAAKLAEGSIYNYFRSKEDLLIHIPQHLVRPALAPLLDAPPRPESREQVDELLLRVAGAMVERIRAHAPFLKVFLSALPRMSAAAREEYMQLLPLHAAEALEQLLRDGKRRGIFRPDLNPIIAARALPGMLMGIVMIQEILLGRRVIPYDYDEIVPELVRIFLYGAMPAGEAPVTARSRPNEARRQ